MDAASGVMVQQRGRHLAAAGVVDAHEEDLRNALHDAPLALPERLETLPREPLGQDGDVGDDPRVLPPPQRLAEVPSDRLACEHTLELRAEAIHGAFQMTNHLGRQCRWPQPRPLRDGERSRSKGIGDVLAMNTR
jgi:hypothetical protein